MVNRDQVLDVCSVDELKVELGLYEGEWALAVFDDLGGNLKTYGQKTDAQQAFFGLKQGELRYAHVFHSIARPVPVNSTTELVP